jgi:medium-chain acyl-[acyl-carrier-protein] hydrolase
MAVPLHQRRWLPGGNAPGARLRLFCLPYAGGGHTIYSRWAALFPPEIGVCPMELPGRLSRLGDEPFREIGPLLDALARALGELRERPFALFGYSMGALLAFELARRLTGDGGRPPEHLLVAARPAPHLPPARLGWDDLPDGPFLEAVQGRYRRIPEPILADPELRAIIVRMMRADLSVVDSYRYLTGPPLLCPITAIGADADPLVPRSSLEAWSRHAGAGFEVHTLPGDHFFIEARPSELVGIVRRQLLQSPKNPRQGTPERPPLDPAGRP